MTKRILSLFLAAVLTLSALGSLVSCGKGKEPPKEKRTSVYAGTDLTIPDGINYINGLMYANDQVYFSFNREYYVTRNEKGEEVAREQIDWSKPIKENNLPEGWIQEFLNEQYLCAVPLDGGAPSEYPLNFDEEAYGNSSGGGSRFIDADGNYVTVTQKWEMNEDYTESSVTYFLIVMNLASGEVLRVEPLNDLLKAAGVDTANSYINGFVQNGDGDYVIATGNSVIIASRDLQLKGNLSLDVDSWLNTMQVLDDGRILVCFGNSSKSQSMLFKVYENGNFTDYSSEALSEATKNYWGFIGAAQNKLYLRTSTGINTFDMTTGIYEEAMNFINSDYDSTNSGSFLALPDGRILISSTEYLEDKTITTMAVYEKVPDDMLEEEIIVRLGMMYSNYALNKAVIRYNRQNKGIRISIVNYEQYNNEENDWNGASEQMKSDIITGKLPDIVLLNNTLPVESYFSKGLFADLNQYIDDPEVGLNRADYLSNVWNAATVNGKLCSLILSFSLNTMLAKTEFVGSDMGWTLADMVACLEQMPEGMQAFYNYSRNEIINTVISNASGAFLDWENMTNAFESDEFIRFMEYLKSCPEKNFWETLQEDPNFVYDNDFYREYEQDMALCYHKNKALFNISSLYGFDNMMHIVRPFLEAPVTAIGYPSLDETSNGAVIVPSMELAISAQSLVKDQAWDIVKYFLNDKNIAANGGGFSPSLAILNERYTSVKDEFYEYDGADIDYSWAVEEGYSEEYIEYMKATNKNVYDQKAVDMVMDLVKGARAIYREDTDLMEIVKEDLSSYFAGVKSAEETAKVIAGRVRIYMSQNG